jgi:predicted RNase H-like HicB family nuclease
MNKVISFTKKEQMEYLLDLFYDIKTPKEALAELKEAIETAEHLTEILKEGGEL